MIYDNLFLLKKDIVFHRGWWDGYFGNPAKICFRHFQEAYQSGYQEGWKYARS